MFQQQSLIDYVFDNKNTKQNNRRNLTIETISYQTSPKTVNVSRKNQSDMQFFLEANNTNESYVTWDIFKTVIQKLDDKLSELEIRLENKESLQHYNSNLVCLRHCKQNLKDFDTTQQKSEISMEDESELKIKTPKQTSIVKIKKQSDDSFINRLNLFEKKLTSESERINKIVKENENFKRNIEQKVNEQIKGYEWSLEKFNKQANNLIIKVDDVTLNHKDFTQHLLKLKDEINFVQANCLQFNEHHHSQKNQLETAVTIIQNYIQSHDKEYVNYKSAIMQIETDLITILSIYREVLKIINVNNC